ncbi:unnamed protein product [Adineta ricciae]|uniref:Uncharacterized protein n=1 Tax=Adineta ricciae TaxID=249248 RepID=A0A815BUW7_ADIRI|nr:unnamed protein product [Adineta ricciae]CAF1277953.1 unnamed protein product [Adineta ricciae]
MSLKQNQSKSDPQQKSDPDINRPKANAQVLRTILSDTKQMSLDEVQIRRTNIPLAPTSSAPADSVKRTSSTPTVNKPVGSFR